jgi:hypothetical protein
MRLIALIALVIAGDATADPKREMFTYAASDGEFTYSITLHADGTWSSMDHGAFGARSGKLSRRALERFGKLLVLAPFQNTRTSCDKPSKVRASYRDSLRGREAHQACGMRVDDATTRLTDCLQTLVRGNDC